MNNKLLIISLFFTISLSSQRLEIDAEKGYTIFSDKGKFLVLDKHNLYEYDNSEWTKSQHNLNLKNYDYKAFKNDSLSYLLSRGGGSVLSYKNEKIEILDNSNYWNSKYESSSFFRKKTLHSFGGYGHYQLRNDLLYFDENLKEWISCFDGLNHFHHFNSHSPFLMRHISQYDESTDILYTGLGHGIDGLNSKIFSYNFKNKKWAETGYTYEKFSDYKIIEGYNPPSFINSSDKQIYSFDLVNNTYTTLDNPNNLYKSITNVYFDNVSERFLIFLDGIDSQLNYLILNKSELFTGKQSSHSLNKKTTILGNYFILLFVLILIPGIIFFIKYRRITIQMILNSQNQVNNSLIKHQKEFLSLILLNHPKSTQFNDLGNLFEFDLAYETKIKKINIAIEKINLLFKKALLTRSDIVIIEKNEEDNRIKEVRLKLNAKKNIF